MGKDPANIQVHSENSREQRKPRNSLAPMLSPKDTQPGLPLPAWESGGLTLLWSCGTR